MTQPDWTALAVPFPDDVVKERPGRGSMTFKYVDARIVAQRLDDVSTPAGWAFTCQQVPGSDIVHGHLDIGGIVREDFGYPNSDHDEEPLKAAASDALKRCAVQFGVGRHLYDDNKAGARSARPVAAPGGPQRQQNVVPPPVSTPRPAAPMTPGPVEPDWMREASPVAAGPMARAAGTAVATDAPPLTTRELLDALEAIGITTAYAGSVAKTMFGTSMLRDLTNEQRGDLMAEIQA